MHMQNLALQITLILIGVLLACFAWVLSRSRTSVAIDQIAPKAYRLRSKLFWLVIVSGLLIAITTLYPWPHDAYASKVSRHIDVKARQWSWELSSQEVKVGEVIEFRVTSEDVNHGFGLYNGSKQVLVQIQAMPGFTNKVRYHFEHPGKYEILCLEYCGVAHHGMVAEITVTPNILH
jgi:cytochrome c oxidase subunit 2